MADWITKKDKSTEWITKKEKPAKKTEWIIKKQPKTNWITKKQQSTPRDEQTRPSGRAGYQGGGRTRLLEELGRVEAEPSNRNRRAEISRVHGELNRGYKHGKRVGKFLGGAATHGFNTSILRKS